MVMLQAHKPAVFTNIFLVNVPGTIDHPLIFENWGNEDVHLLFQFKLQRLYVLPLMSKIYL